MGWYVIVATIPVGQFPVGVAVSPDGSKVYVGNQATNNVSVIATASNTVVATVPLGGAPLAVAASGSAAYVSTDSGTLSVVAASLKEKVANFPVSPAVGMVLSPDQSKLYLTCGDNTIKTISTVTNAVINSVPIADLDYGIAVTPDGSKIYAALTTNNVVVFSTLSNSVIATIPVGSFPSGIAVTPDGSRVYVSNQDSNTVSVIATATNTVIATVPAGSRPVGVALSTDGTKVYVANSSSNNVSVISTATNTVIATIPAGNGPLALGVFIQSGFPFVPPPPTVPTLSEWATITLVLALGLIAVGALKRTQAA